MYSILGIRIILSFCCLLPHLAWAGDTITLFFHYRPPYLVPAANGSASGLSATPAANAFKSAGIPFVWSMAPTNRQLLAIKANSGMACAVGWFKNPERERFAKFTKAIHRDLPTIGLANRAFTTRVGVSLEETLATPGVRVLVKENFSYGAFIDGLLNRLKPAIVRTTNENVSMAKMIGLNLADFMLASEEEASVLNSLTRLDTDTLHLIRFSDTPAGEKRHIMCSKQVSDDIITRLNAAIKFE